MILNKDNIDIKYFIQASTVGPIGTSGQVLRKARFKNLLAGLQAVSIKGHILEFGVRHGGKGSSFKYISEFFPDKTIHGFDSFIGLPEDWKITESVIAKAREQVVKEPVCPKNGVFWKGWFKDSIKRYLNKYPKKPIAFLHIDSDIYSSAITVLEKLNDVIVPGTVIVFDELYPFGLVPYDTWQEHEWKALLEWMTRHNRQIDVISRNHHWQACIKVVV